MEALLECMTLLNLLIVVIYFELELFGIPFTWFNKMSDSSSIFQKLDRFPTNEQWIYSVKDADR